VLEFFRNSLLFAQEAAPAAPAEGDPNALNRLLLMILGFGFLMYFMMIRPQKRKEQAFRKLVSDLKENDHVVTIGGIHGVVTNVQRDAERVTIRVDESTGAKLRVSASAIARVATDDDDGGGATSELSK
jgi:preprotein translocase subunit YajC